MTVRTKTMGDGVVTARKIAKSVRQHSYWFEPFSQAPIAFSATGFDNPTGADTVVNNLFTGFNLFQWYNIGTQTTFIPAMTTDGNYDVGFEQTAADGVELIFGGVYTTATANHPRNYTSGTDEYYARLKFSCEDISGLDLWFGFRKHEAHQATLTGYTDLFGLQALGDSSSAAAAVNTVTQLNDVTEVTTTAQTTLADTIAMEFEVHVTGRTAKFLIDGVPVNTEFTVDTDDVVLPTLRVLQTTDVSGEVKLIAAEGGLSVDHPGGLLAAT